MPFRIKITFAAIFLIILMFAVAYIGANLHFDNNTLLLISLVGTGIAAYFAYGTSTGK